MKLRKGKAKYPHALRFIPVRFMPMSAFRFANPVTINGLNSTNTTNSTLNNNTVGSNMTVSDLSSDLANEEKEIYGNMT